MRNSDFINIHALFSQCIFIAYTVLQNCGRGLVPITRWFIMDWTSTTAGGKGAQRQRCGNSVGWLRLRELGYCRSDDKPAQEKEDDRPCLILEKIHGSGNKSMEDDGDHRFIMTAAARRADRRESWRWIAASKVKSLGRHSISLSLYVNTLNVLLESWITDLDYWGISIFI